MTTNGKIEFLDHLPDESPRGRPPQKYAAFLAELRKHPGQWALAPQTSRQAGSSFGRTHGLQTAMRQGKIYVRVPA